MTSTQFSEARFQDSELSKRSFRFGGKKATSQIIAWPILILLSFNLSSTGISQAPEIRLILLRVTVAALVCAGIYFTVLGALINISAPQLGKMRTICIGFLYATTELVRAVLIQIFAQASGLSINPQWGFRIIAAVTTGLLVFVLISTVVNDSDVYRSSYRELVNQRIRLSSVLNASLENLLRARDQLIQTTRDQLAQALRSTLSETQKKKPELPLIIQNLFSVAENVVRPLSHSLFDDPLMLSPQEIEGQVPRVPIKSVVIKSTVVAPFRPGLITVMALLISVPSILLDHTFPHVLQWIGALLLIFVGNFLAKKYLGPKLASIPLFFRILVNSLFYASLSVYLVHVSLNEVVLPSELFGESILYGSILGIVLGWLIAASAGMRSARIEILNEIGRINDELAWQNARIQSEMWLDQKSLALTLHNDVQATLLAAALKLKAAIEADPQSAMGALPEITDLINRSINFGSTAVRDFSLKSIISRINENWAGVITMRFNTSEETLKRIESDIVAMGVLEDVLSEFQNNSLKHGQATETIVIFTSPQSGILQVAMTNNGNRLSHNIQNGLGSAFLKSVALNFKLENFSRGVKLTVWLPVATSVEIMNG